MKSFVALFLAGMLCGCGGNERAAPIVNRAGDKTSETNERSLTGSPTPPRSADLIEAAKRTDIEAIEKVIRPLTATKMRFQRSFWRCKMTTTL